MHSWRIDGFFPRGASRPTTIGLVALAAVLSWAGTGCRPQQPGPESSADSENVLELTDGDFEQTVAGGVTLVDFWAPWCGPCRVQGPIVARVADKVGTTAKVAKLNVDHNREAAGKYGIRSIPTLIVFKDGAPVQQFVGVQQEAELIAAIEAALK